MNRYQIYCTEAQTERALKLGAPLFRYTSIPNFTNVIEISASEYCEIPTAEEMIGWLEEQKIFVDIAPCFDISCSWRIESKGYNKYEYTSDIKVCKTRKEATLAAIDAALKYLENNKLVK